MENAPKNFFHNSLPNNLDYNEISIMAFDKDNTISPPNKPLDREIAKNLADITRERVVVILTARDFQTCQEQILNVISEFSPRISHFILACSNGSQIYRFDKKEKQYILKTELTGTIELYAARDQILALAKEFFGRDDIVLEQRSNTMGAIFPPRTLSDEERKNFDPTGEKRRRFIEKLRELQIFPETYEIIAGGSTSVDIGLHDKQAGMENLINFFRYSAERHGEILFMGDGFPWNDSPVLNIDGINVVRVDNYEVTKKLLADFVKK